MINEKAYNQITQQVNNKKATLVAVSKFKSPEEIQKVYDLGQRDFGENYVQELTAKQQALPRDINWHFIGHLQRNKVKDIASFIHLIHSVDSFRLLKEINKQAKKNNRIINCLLQVHVTDEENKTGMDDKELLEFTKFYEAQANDLKNIKIKGMMGMATFTDDRKKIRQDFKEIKSMFEFARQTYFLFQENFQILSMGMSADYDIALEEGSNMVRVGSKIFGARNKK